MSASETTPSTGYGALRNATYVQKIFEWEVQNFFDLPPNMCTDSPIFTCFGVECCLRIYPDNLVDKGCVSLFLIKRFSPFEVPVSFTLGIKTVSRAAFNSEDWNEKCPMMEYTYGDRKFIERSELVRLKHILVPENTLTVFCAFHLKESDEAGLETLSKDFRESFLTGTQSDIKISVKGKEFSAHKMVLSARSPVFRAMLELDMSEKNNNFINITDCDPDNFEEFLLYLYSGKLDIVSPSNALSLFSIADKYNIEDLKKQCATCLARSVSVDSVCDVIQLATVHDEADLLDFATDFFIENASIIIRTQKWISFMAENLALANELLIKMADKYRNGFGV